MTTKSISRLPHAEQTSRWCQFRDGQLGAVALRHVARIGLDLVAAIAAPYDEPRMGRGGAAERRGRHRRETASWEHVHRGAADQSPKRGLRNDKKKMTSTMRAIR